VFAFAVLPVFATLVVPPTAPEDGCPSARQVTDAMLARFPALLVAPERPAATALSDVLRAVLDVAPDGTVVRFSLVDNRGEVQLRRTLPASGRGTALADCVALADTVAAIVERYLSNIDYETVETGHAGSGDAMVTAGKPPGFAGPTSTAGARQILGFLGGGWRTTTGGQGARDQNAFETRLGVQLGLLPSVPPLEAMASLGASQGLEFPLQSAPGTSRQMTMRRIPLRIGCLLELPVGVGWVEPTLQAGVDVMTFSSTRSSDPGTDMMVRFPPAVEVGVGYRLNVVGKISLRAGITLGVDLTRYDISLPSAPDITVLTTPRAYGLFGMEAGWLFR
jgi:hypothetical protein